MPAHRFEPAEALLRSGLDLTQPFTSEMAAGAGLDARRLRRIVDADLLTRPLRGAYHLASLPDTILLRIACARLVVPADCVVTDRTAGWLHGTSMTLAPNDHLVVPRISVFQAPGHRLRNDLTASGERSLKETDVIDLDGLRVTTPLRTACDLGRLLHRDSALAALDALLGLGSFDREQLLAEIDRFRGFRGVRQLRAFAPIADPGAESFGESALRLRWYDAVLTEPPETQLQVEGPDGRIARLDLGTRTHRYAAEYDGVAFHGPEQESHDLYRRDWLRDLGWTVDVFRRHDVFGRDQRVIPRLVKGFQSAKLHFHARSGG